ncbi:MAG: hypothetical protein ACREBU_05260 [Nitrososphaera sp.]
MAKMALDIKVVDKQGRVTYETHVIPNSKVTALIAILYSQMRQIAGDGSTTNDTGGIARAFNPNSAVLNANATISNNAFGIQVGTGVAGVALADFSLATLIAEGIGVGQLNYGAMSILAPLTIGSTRRFTAARTLTNNSGASITVNEVGFVVQAVGAGTWNFLIERTLLTFAIPNLATATVTYTISVTV